MRTGVCTTDFEIKDSLPMPAEELFTRIRDFGFTCTQFAFSSVRETEFRPDGAIEIPAVISPAVLRLVGECAEKYRLPIGVINGTFNMTHPDAEIRREGLRRFAVLTEAAAELGVPYISLCSGTRNTDSLWAPSPLSHTDDAWADMEDTMLRAVELAEKSGVTLAIESEAANVIDTPEAARRIMDRCASDRLKMILDCANLFHKGRAHPEFAAETITHAFDLFGNDIVIAHGKDIREGDGIDFCGTGLGIVDFALTARLLKQYDYRGEMYLHGIYDMDDMPRAIRHWENAAM